MVWKRCALKLYQQVWVYKYISSPYLRRILVINMFSVPATAVEVLLQRRKKLKSFLNHCQTWLKHCQSQWVVHSHCTIYFPAWFCPKGSEAWWVCNQQALLGLSLYVVRLSLMCAAVNTGSSLPTTVSWGMRLSTRTLMSTLEGSHSRKMLQL